MLLSNRKIALELIGWTIFFSHVKFDLTHVLQYIFSNNTYKNIKMKTCRQ